VQGLRINGFIFGEGGDLSMNFYYKGLQNLTVEGQSTQPLSVAGRPAPGQRAAIFSAERTCRDGDDPLK
jgi:hypothetical protein